ncbi:MAG TPA: primosomal protein N' [Gammaproteobacteria bacterium]|nr:primosomal protein N' [Gammaproteobacteria bacterium]
MFILQVAVPTPLYRLFDYIAPDNFTAENFKPGLRVKIPWRDSTLTGILLSTSDKSSINPKKLKQAEEILDTESLFSESILKLIIFAADYYHYPIGEVFAAALPTLLRQGRSTEYKHHAFEFESLPEVPLVLTGHQKIAVDKIISELNNFKPFLLFGVTGSGKTEVYLQIISEVLKQNKQALILVPEIGLTPQTVMRFQMRFPVIISVLHSGLTDSERHSAWLQAKNGDAKIVIGTRSAVFASLKNPGVIILDEEHDLSFKQQEGFKYSARDLGVLRAQFESIPIVLGSATPSLESLHNVESKRYELLTLPERAGEAVHPSFILIDLKKQAAPKGLSIALLESIQKHLKDNNQVLVFLNRRGYSPTLICHHCGWIATCRQCDANMTIHNSPSHLQCHHCGASRPVDRKCLECHSTSLAPLGTGTERIEENLKEYFPETPIIRIDRDSTRKKGSLEKKLANVHEGEACILVGTQMLAKGHHFKNVTLAVILNADSGLFSSDFRGSERTAQLILQVAGRSGRAEKPGEVILQTYHPEHSLLNILLNSGYEDFAKNLLKEREEAQLPPYHFMAMIRAEGLKIELVIEFLNQIKTYLNKDNAVFALGPLPAPMQKKAGKHRGHLLLQSNNRSNLKRVLNQLTSHLSEIKSKQNVRWSIDVDPMELF